MERGNHGPLPSEHYNNIRPESLISVMIKGRNYVECGVLYETTLSSQEIWVYDSNARPPFGPDRAYITVGDPDRRRRPQRHDKYFATELEARFVYHAAGYENPESEVFIKQDNHVYHATLSTVLQFRDNFCSLVSVICEYRPNEYRSLHGVLKVWDDREPLPKWVLQAKPNYW